MAIFMDTGGGDIYAAETKEECIKAMLEDNPECPVDEAFEVDGSMLMRAESEDETPGEELVTLESLYTPLSAGYCIASTNC